MASKTPRALRKKATADVDDFLASVGGDSLLCASPGPTTMASTHYIAESEQKCGLDREITHARAKRMEELAEIDAREKKRA